jgi:hypothetical protein
MISSVEIFRRLSEKGLVSGDGLADERGADSAVSVTEIRARLRTGGHVWLAGNVR